MKEADEPQLSTQPFSEFDLPLRVFVGTYTGALYALESVSTIRELLSSALLPPPSPSSSSPTPSPPSFFTLFSHDAHRQSVHALCTSPTSSYLLSSGPDETIQVYSLAPRPTHQGSLHRHYSSITALSFPSHAHFLSASEDGTINIFALPHFELAHRLRATRGSTQSLDVHPSGKAALTAGRDAVVRVWDLVKGTERTRRFMGEEKKSITEGGSGQAHEQLLVRWRGAGTGYAMARGRRLTLFDDAGEVECLVALPSKALSFRCVRGLVVAGCEDGSVVCYRKGERVGEGRHEARVRCVETVEVDGGEAVLVVSASTDGQVWVWRLGKGDEDGALVKVAGAKGNGRITALCASVAWDERREAIAAEERELVAMPPVEAKEESQWSEAQLRRKEKKRRALEAKLAHHPPQEAADVDISAAAQAKAKAKVKKRKGNKAALSVTNGHAVPAATNGSATQRGAVVVVNRKRRAQ